MAKRSLVLLAGEYDPLKYKPNNAYVSEKLDGIRALWLPFTRGLSFRKIPWANTLRDDRDYVCSGLWTRRGKTIVAPESFLDGLPKDMPLDGELYAGRGLFQKTTSTVRKLTPVEEEWNGINYKVFDIPCYMEFFRPGTIREGGTAGDPAYEVHFKPEWVQQFPGVRQSEYFAQRRFSDNVMRLERCGSNGPWQPVEQKKLPHQHQAAQLMIDAWLADVTALNGEGLMLRQGHSIWEPTRSKDLVKVKPMHDSEAQIVGYRYGNGKYRGMVGAFTVRWNPTTSRGPVFFDLSGFTDVEREIRREFVVEAEESEGLPTRNDVSKFFPLGTTVTFCYNDLTADGVPRFARYLRKWEAV